MKAVVLQVGVLVLVAMIAYVAGYGPTESKWGEEGIASLKLALVICLTATVLAAIPLGVTARWWPAYTGQAAFGAIGIRLLVTGSLALACQVLLEVHLESFLWWLLLLYLPLMTVETAMAIFIVKRQMNRERSGEGM